VKWGKKCIKLCQKQAFTTTKDNFVGYRHTSVTFYWCNTLKLNSGPDETAGTKQPGTSPGGTDQGNTLLDPKRHGHYLEGP